MWFTIAVINDPPPFREALMPSAKHRHRFLGLTSKQLAILIVVLGLNCLIFGAAAAMFSDLAENNSPTASKFPASSLVTQATSVDNRFPPVWTSTPAGMRDTATRQPTDIPKPTNTKRPSSTPLPTATPRPTRIPRPTSTPNLERIKNQITVYLWKDGAQGQVDIMDYFLLSDNNHLALIVEARCINVPCDANFMAKVVEAFAALIKSGVKFEANLARIDIGIHDARHTEVWGALTVRLEDIVEYAHDRLTFTELVRKALFYRMDQ